LENLEGMLDLVENYTCGLLPLMITRKIVGIQVWSKSMRTEPHAGEDERHPLEDTLEKSFSLEDWSTGSSI
jgi:hypothetical protein